LENIEKISIKSEIQRKTIHLISIFIPIGYYFLSKPTGIALSFIGMVLMLWIDRYKSSNKNFAKTYTKYLGSVLRIEEKNFKKKKYTGGTYLAIGVFVTVFFFMKEIALAALTIVIVCDSLSALVGKTIRKIKII